MAWVRMTKSGTSTPSTTGMAAKAVEIASPPVVASPRHTNNDKLSHRKPCEYMAPHQQR